MKTNNHIRKGMLAILFATLMPLGAWAQQHSAVQVTKQNDGSWTFTMPDADLKAYVTQQIVSADEIETTEDKEINGIDNGGVYYATTYGEYAYKIDANTTAYTATINNGSLILSEVVDNIIPEGSPVILKSFVNPIVITPLDETPGIYTDALDKDFADNDLKGQKSPKTPTADNPVYVLDRRDDVLGFFPADGAVSAYTAFIEFADADAQPADKKLLIVPDYTTAALNMGGDNSTNLKFFRTFTDGVASTVCLPYEFNMSAIGTLYQFRGVDKDATGQWTATMQETADAAAAGKPYLFMPQNTKTVRYQGDFHPGQTVQGVDEVGDWSLKGMFQEKTWTTADGKTYGFSADDKGSISAGDFVKVGDYTHIRPLRAYMQYIGTGVAPAPRRGAMSVEQLPERIKVVLVNAAGETTAIGELNTITGDAEITEWYDLNGRKLTTKPSQKGVYIQNGKKVTVKK